MEIFWKTTLHPGRRVSPMEVMWRTVLFWGMTAVSLTEPARAMGMCVGSAI